MLQEDPQSRCSELLQRASSYLELSLLGERPYITYTLAVTLFNFGYFVPYFHLVAHSRQAGFSEYQAAFVMSAAGATDILGRVVSGWFSDLGHFRTVHLLTLWTVLAGAFIMLLPVSSLTGSYTALVVISLLYGFSAGALTSLVFAVVPMIVGVQRVMGGLGLLQLIESSAGLLGTPLSGQCCHPERWWWSVLVFNCFCLRAQRLAQRRHRGLPGLLHGGRLLPAPRQPLTGHPASLLLLQ